MPERSPCISTATHLSPLFTLLLLLAAGFWIAGCIQWRRPGRLVLHGINGLSLTAVAVLILRPEQLVLQKQLTSLAMPLGMMWLGLGLLGVVALTRRQGFTAIVSLLLMGGLTLSANNRFSNWMIRQIEAPYLEHRALPVGDLSGDRSFDAVVLLGGSTARTPAGGYQLNAFGDRVALTARLYHAGLAARLICTGRGDPAVLGPGRHPAAESQRLLEDLGVPSGAIVQLGGDHTREEMTLLVESIEAGAGKRLGLVTSAFHMARAERLAASVGLDVIPLPAGFYSRPPEDIPLRITPDIQALGKTTIAIKELLAGLVGR